MDVCYSALNPLTLRWNCKVNLHHFAVRKGDMEMDYNRIKAIARNVTAGFLLTLGMTPSEGEDTLEVREYGPHLVMTQQARVPDSMAATIDPVETLDKLTAYLNALPTAIRFEPYNVEVYICPCGCGTFLYVSICHTA